MYINMLKNKKTLFFKLWGDDETYTYTVYIYTIIIKLVYT